jgi:Transglycosylase-like domain
MRESRLANFYLAGAILALVSFGANTVSSVSTRHSARHRRSERRAGHVTESGSRLRDAILVGGPVPPPSQSSVPSWPDQWTVSAQRRELSVLQLAVQQALQHEAAKSSAQAPVSSAAGTTQQAGPSVSPAVLAAWSKVNMCEEGGDWSVQGSAFSGGLGISNANWVAYGGTEFSPDAADATPAEQIIVAQRIDPDPPDQDGCSGGW